MAEFYELHPVNPQVRLVRQLAQGLRSGKTLALPTDSGYAIGCTLGNKEGMDTIRNIRRLDDKHNFSLLCHSFTQLGELVIVNNSAFRTIKALTPGAYTFILKGTKEVPRMTLNKKKHTIGVRIPDHVITQAIVAELGEPLLCSTLIPPGEDDPLSEGWIVDQRFGSLIDMIVSSPVGEAGPTTVIDFSDGAPIVVRHGAGSTSLFE